MFKCSIHSWESYDTPCIAYFPIVMEDTTTVSISVDKNVFKPYQDELRKTDILQKSEQGITAELKKKVSDYFDYLDEYEKMLSSLSICELHAVYNYCSTQNDGKFGMLADIISKHLKSRIMKKFDIV